MGVPITTTPTPSAPGIGNTDITETSPLLVNRENTPISADVLKTPSSSDSSSSRSSLASSSISSADPSDEEALNRSDPAERVPPRQQLSHAAIFRIICVLLIAVFVFNADGSIVLATHPLIASEFNALESSSWLFTGFGLAGAATQSMISRLSDIYGRKPVILACYAGFTIGCIIVGLGQSMVTVILGRVLSGGVGAGATVLVSLLITDLIPFREVAAWRAYVNVAATTGRSLGGPLGGWLADMVGWRWSFLGQTPFLLLAIVLCYFYLPSSTPKLYRAIQDTPQPSSSKLARIDFLGSTLLALSVLSFLLPMEIGGVKLPWTHPIIFTLFGCAALLLGLFILTEKHWAKVPVLPLDIFARRDVVISFMVMALQVAAQMGLMFSVPLYFQVTQRLSNTEAGAHLFPAVAGNAMGSILAGLLIKKSGKYKWLAHLATLSSSTCYFMVMLRWHGHTNWLESLYIIPGGFGAGVAQSAIFISIQAAVDPKHLAPAISTLFLSTGVGGISGLAIVSAATQEGLRRSLQERLLGLDLDAAQRAEIVQKAVSNVRYVYETTGKIGEAVSASYVDGIWCSHGVSLIFSMLGFCLSFLLREYKL